MRTFSTERQVEYPDYVLEHSDDDIDQQDDEDPEEDINQQDDIDQQDDEEPEEDTDQQDDEWAEEEYRNGTWPRKHLLQAFDEFCEPGGHTIEDIIQIDALIHFDVNTENINEYDMESGYYLTSENMIKGDTRQEKIRNRVRFFKQIQEIISSSLESVYCWVSKSLPANHEEHKAYYEYNWIDDEYNKRYKIFSKKPVGHGEDTIWFITCDKKRWDSEYPAQESEFYGLTRDQELSLVRVFNTYCKYDTSFHRRVREISQVVGYDINTSEWCQYDSFSERLETEGCTELILDNEIKPRSNGSQRKTFFSEIQKVISPETPCSDSKWEKNHNPDSNTRPVDPRLDWVYSWTSEATRKKFKIFPKRAFNDSNRTQWFLIIQDY